MLSEVPECGPLLRLQGLDHGRRHDREDAGADRRPRCRQVLDPSVRPLPGVRRGGTARDPEADCRRRLLRLRNEHRGSRGARGVARGGGCDLPATHHRDRRGLAGAGRGTAGRERRPLLHGAWQRRPALRRCAAAHLPACDQPGRSPGRIARRVSDDQRRLFEPHALGLASGVARGQAPGTDRSLQVASGKPA